MPIFDELKKMISEAHPTTLAEIKKLNDIVGAEAAKLPRTLSNLQVAELISMIPTGWGTKFVPKDQWIDTNKTYKTRNGKDIVGLTIQLTNENGNEVTFPVKASIVVRKKPYKTRYQIFTLDGRSTLWGNDPDDLILTD